LNYPAFNFEEEEKFFESVFRKVFPIVFIPISALLGISIYIRIKEFGFTEPIYIVLMIFFWLSFFVFYAVS